MSLNQLMTSLVSCHGLTFNISHNLFILSNICLLFRPYSFLVGLSKRSLRLIWKLWVMFYRKNHSDCWKQQFCTKCLAKTLVLLLVKFQINYLVKLIRCNYTNSTKSSNAPHLTDDCREEETTSILLSNT